VCIVTFHSSKSLFVSSLLAAVALPAEPVDTLTGKGTRPIAAVFACSSLPDSPERLLDRRPGELFVVQKANVDFAVSALGVPLVVVLGGDSCTQAGLASKDAVLKAVADIRQGSATVRELEAAGELQVMGATVDESGLVTFLASD
jgi:carbonic anhydrase